MICPECGSEYVDGVATCPDCDLPLVEPEPEEALATPKPRIGETRPEPVVVLATGRGELIAIAKSILMAANIEYAVRGEEIQDMFGYGRFPAGRNLISGPVEIMVAAGDADDASEALADLRSSVTAPAVPEEESVAGSESTATFGDRARIAARIVAALLLLSIAIGWLMYLLEYG